MILRQCPITKGLAGTAVTKATFERMCAQHQQVAQDAMKIKRADVGVVGGMVNIYCAVECKGTKPQELTFIEVSNMGHMGTCKNCKRTIQIRGKGLCAKCFKEEQDIAEIEAARTVPAVVLPTTATEPAIVGFPSAPVTPDVSAASSDEIIATIKTLLGQVSDYGKDENATIKEIMDELGRARGLHPAWPGDNIHQVAIMIEEAGEAMQAAIDLVYSDAGRLNLRLELVQTAAMCIRCLVGK